jgi:hypothetical protein
MAMREFRDSVGVAWRVWMTTPHAGAIYEERFRAGWLTFENDAGNRKRLAPIPRGWEEATCQRLELMCRVAEARSPGATPDPGPLDRSRSE